MYCWNPSARSHKRLIELMLDVARDGQLTIQAGEWKAAARKGLMENYEFPAPFIKPGRNRLTVLDQFEKDDHNILIGYVSAVVVSKRISLKSALTSNDSFCGRAGGEACLADQWLLRGHGARRRVL